MASYAKRTNGWRTQIAIQGVRESKVLSTKAEAIAWASARETEIRAGKATGVKRGRTVSDAFKRYEKEVSVHKDGHRWEALRLARRTSRKLFACPLPAAAEDMRATARRKYGLG